MQALIRKGAYLISIGRRAIALQSDVPCGPQFLDDNFFTIKKWMDENDLTYDRLKELFKQSNSASLAFCILHRNGFDTSKLLSLALGDERGNNADVAVVSNLMKEYARIKDYDSCREGLTWIESNCASELTSRHFAYVLECVEESRDKVMPLWNEMMRYGIDPSVRILDLLLAKVDTSGKAIISKDVLKRPTLLDNTSILQRVLPYAPVYMCKQMFQRHDGDIRCADGLLRRLESVYVQKKEAVSYEYLFKILHNCARKKYYKMSVDDTTISYLCKLWYDLCNPNTFIATDMVWDEMEFIFNWKYYANHTKPNACMKAYALEKMNGCKHLKALQQLADHIFAYLLRRIKPEIRNLGFSQVYQCFLLYRDFVVPPFFLRSVTDHLIQCQHRLFDLFTSHGLLEKSDNHNQHHVFDLYQVQILLEVFAKFHIFAPYITRMLTDQAKVSLEAIVTNNRSLSLKDWWKKDQLEKSLHVPGVDELTQMVETMSSISHYHKLFYRLIASEMIKHIHGMELDMLVRWCVSMATVTHREDSIWLHLYTHLFHHKNRTNAKHLIDMLWSFHVMGLSLDKSWQSDLAQQLTHIAQECTLPSGRISPSRLQDEIPIAQQIRLYEYLCLTKNALDCRQDLVVSLLETYQQYMGDKFVLQCQQRSSLRNTRQYLLSHGLNLECGTVFFLDKYWCALADIIIPSIKVVITFADPTQVTWQSGKPMEWLRSPGQRHVTNQIFRNFGYSVLVLGNNEKDIDKLLWIVRYFEYKSLRPKRFNYSSHLFETAKILT
ncbi:hypothetical protein RFI_17781 [Reticulomyxa filosa]|uniref:Uncharacterized protein n=1 Tax=Reticulomyxa filosa TaxID=46433 RepID=X6MZJ7_RETFI|nr:hypothetical protein RFI_17781 [Reticulomyxa filosa]|eukprot:ETO19445.1 hypothetical protein RFI_17781 [Reticulomyxa filosa]